MDLDQEDLSKGEEQKEDDEKFHVQVTECGNNTVNKYGCWRPIDGTLFKLGYKFNTTGQLCDRKTGEVFVLESNYADNEQQRNDVVHLLDAIRHEVPSILMEKFSMKLIEFPLPAEKDSEYDKLKSEFVLATDDLSTNTTGLAVLIEGFGTAGQWDPMLVLSEGLEQGSQISSVSKCIENGWSVFILHASCLCSTDVNTNDGSANGEKLLENVRNGHHNADIFNGYSRACLHSCCGNCLERLMEIWEKYILELPIEKIAIVANRCGGFLAENILKTFTKSTSANGDRLKAVCLCDWAMSTVPYDQWWRTAVRKCRNWVPSARPCGAREKTRNGVGCVSAGTRDNRQIPVFALDNMIDFIKEAFLESD